MATTTNYSWTTPDDTDLVKDGAAAIRTLGSSIDTSVKALSPGTTAGDVDYYTTSTAKARLAIGTAGQVLQVNSGATAPEWATPASGGMTLISTTTLTGASVTLSSIPATFTDLRIVVRNFRPATDDEFLKLRFNGDSAARYDSSSAGSRSNNAFIENGIEIAPDSDNGTSSSLSVTTIYDYANAVTFKMSKTHVSITNDGATPANGNMGSFNGYYNQTGAISSLVFLPNAGNFTSGEILLYGVK